MWLGLGLSLIILSFSWALVNKNEVIWFRLEIFTFLKTNFSLRFFIDSIRILFFFTVTWISLAIYIFSRNYIKSELYYVRFHILLSLFILSIALLVFRRNLWFRLIGWDGLGLRSFLLVVYYGRRKSFNAGFLTLMRNRVGDSFLIITLRILGFRSSYEYLTFNILRLKFIFCGLFFLAACTKRAQFPFSAWLPAAIAAPTPVSSLVHSSTLVTAGVYILIRCPMLILYKVQRLLLVISRVTLVISGLTALIEEDMKKIVALSTLSQLGVIIFTLSIKSYNLAFLHLVRHAFFKALLFLAVGGLIHRSNDYQEIRHRGVCGKELPLRLSFAIAAKLRLCGLPFLRGFYSKDFCLEWAETSLMNFIIIIALSLGTGLTVIYSLRFIIVIFSLFRFSTSLKFREEFRNIHNKSIVYLLFPALYFSAIFKESNFRLIECFSFSFLLKSWVSFLIIFSILVRVAIFKTFIAVSKKRKITRLKILGLADYRGYLSNKVSGPIRWFIMRIWDKFWSDYIFLFISIKQKFWLRRLTQVSSKDLFVITFLSLLYLFWIWVY